MFKMRSYAFIILLIVICGCGEKENKMAGNTFKQDAELVMRKDPKALILSDKSGQSEVLVSPGFQGKVFTSTLNGPEGISIGWVNEKALTTDTLDPHMNAYGGENRLWLGPEGSKYSIFFSKGSDYEFNQWHTPAPIDHEPWTLDSADTKSAWMSHRALLVNMQGMAFDVMIHRSVTLQTIVEAEEMLETGLKKGIKMVGYTTDNTITNTGEKRWTKETGTISIWMLDMFSPSDRTIIMVPFQDGAPPEVITTDYFGEIGHQRLRIKDNVIYLLADGRSRGKIGVKGAFSHDWAASYDPVNQLFTYVKFDLNNDASYLNQEWNDEKDPFQGDAVNAYNDGPLEDGNQMGPFYELESSSPAALLSPGESMSHRHSVFHFYGGLEELGLLVKDVTGIELSELNKIFNTKEK